MFEVEIGKGCQVLRIALCKYPTEHTAYDGVVIPTNIPPYYNYDCSVDTEKAYLEGKEHFMRCHRTVIEIIEKLQDVGFLIKMEDKAGYWPNHSIENLEAAAKGLSYYSCPEWYGLKPWGAKPKGKAKGKAKTKKKVKKKSPTPASPLFLHQRYKTVRRAKQLSEAEQEALRGRHEKILEEIETFQ